MTRAVLLLDREVPDWHSHRVHRHRVWSLPEFARDIDALLHEVHKSAWLAMGVLAALGVVVATVVAFAVTDQPLTAILVLLGGVTVIGFGVAIKTMGGTK